MTQTSIQPVVAVVEDDPGLCVDLVEFLQLRGMDARGFGCAETFFQVWPVHHFDLLLLDVVLPGASGLEIVQRVRETDGAGIIMLTALDASCDQVAGLGAGADAYLSKRSSLEVIEATCRSVLRRLAMTQHAPRETNVVATVATSGHWRLHRKKWTLEAPGGADVSLTHTEMIFLATLFAIPGEAVARDRLLTLLGKSESISNLRNLDNAASRLRRKVKQACGIELPVRPSYGRGYTFTEECEVRE